MSVTERGNSGFGDKLHRLIEAGDKQQVFDLVTSRDWLRACQVPNFPYYHHYLNDLRQAQYLFETDIPNDVPQRAALTFAETLVREVFNDIQNSYRSEELLSFLLLTGHDIDNVIIPFSLIFSKSVKRVQYLRHIGKLLLQINDVDRARKVFAHAADILCTMPFSQIMEEDTDCSLWGCERILVESGCDLATFGILDQRIIDRLAEISRTPSEDRVFESVLYKGYRAIARRFAESGILPRAIEATEHALNCAPQYYYQNSMQETRQQAYQELVTALINSGYFDQVENLLKILESEQLGTIKLWQRYLEGLDKASKFEHLQTVVRRIADKSDPHPHAEEILNPASISLRWRDIKALLALSPEEMREGQKQAEAYNIFIRKLTVLRAYYATRFKIYICQCRFENARLALDQMFKLQELSNSSDENRYQIVDSWFEQHEVFAHTALQFVKFDDGTWSYTPNILPESARHSTSDLVYQLLVQGQYELLKRLDDLENPRRWQSTQIQTLLELKDIRTLEQLEEFNFSELYGHGNETRAEAYRYLVFKFTLSGRISAIDQVPHILGYDNKLLFIAHAQAIALNQSLEAAFELLRPILGDSYALDRVRFELAAPFLWLQDIEQAENNIYQCYEWRHIWIDAGKPSLTSLLWRLSTSCTAPELATKVKDYIQRGWFELANAIEFARDMVFVDEHYARDFMLTLLKLWLPVPSINFVGEILRSVFKDNQDIPIDVPKEALSELEASLDTSINPGALEHLANLESYLSESSLRWMFSYLEFSILELAHKGELWFALGETAGLLAESKPENFVNELLELLESLQTHSDRSHLEVVYETFPLKVFVCALWAFKYPRANTRLISELEKDLVDILPRMDFEADFRLWVFANCLGILSSERSPKRALQVLNTYCEYALQQIDNDDTTRTNAERIRIRSFVLPYILLTAPASEQRDRLFNSYLGEIGDLNILLQMWTYFDAHNDAQAAEHIMRRMITLAGETGISLQPFDFPQGSGGGAA